MNENKQREIIDLLKARLPGNYGDAFKSLTEENQKNCFNLFFELIDLWKEEKNQIVNDDYVSFMGGNLIDDKFKSLPEDQKEKYIFNKVKIEDLEEKLLRLISYTLKSHWKGGESLKEKYDKWEKEYYENESKIVF